MSISSVRTYIQTRIAAVDATLLENDRDPFNVEDVTTSESDKFYKLVIGEAEQTNTAGNAYGLEVQMNLIIYARPDRDEITTYDSLYDKAIDVRESILAPCEVKNQADFSDIIGANILPGVEESNDQLFRMDLQFTVRIDNFYT